MDVLRPDILARRIKEGKYYVYIHIHTFLRAKTRTQTAARQEFYNNYN